MTDKVVRYVCATCGRAGIPDFKMTLLDDRYAVGRCTNPDHPKERRYLVREDIELANPRRKTKPKLG